MSTLAAEIVSVSSLLATRTGPTFSWIIAEIALIEIS